MFIQNYEDLDVTCKEQAEVACIVGQRVLDLKSQAHPELVKLFKNMCLELSIKSRRQVEVLEVRGEVFMNFRTDMVPLSVIQVIAPTKLITPKTAAIPAKLTERIKAEWKW